MPNKNLNSGLISITIFLFLFIYGCATVRVDTRHFSYSSLEPEEVVRIYFNSWDLKDYKVMYALISDGFKDIDPYAKDLQTFSNYMSKYFKTGKAIILKDVKEVSNDGLTSVVDYTILMNLKAGDKEFSGTYTLKKRVNGWKLIHPYGDKIDTS